MERTVIIWTALMIAFLIIEILTVGLTTIWMAGGALAALILDLAGVSIGIQIAVFIIVSFVLLIFTRPFAMKHVNSKHEKTNYEELIGKEVIITEKVDNLMQTGKTTIRGIDWTVRSIQENITLETGDRAVITEISGVTLIVKKLEEETK